jgi:UDP-N-acetylmuramoylalanine--D-glutamate ligase
MYYIVGLGRSGQATAQWMQHNTLDFVVWDDHEDLQIHAKLSGWQVIEPSKLNWKHISSIVLSPGLSIYGEKKHLVVQLAEKYNIPIIGDVELFYKTVQHSDAKIIGITGTNGKSTTHAMVDYLLKESTISCFSCGNNGIPVLSFPTPVSQFKAFNIEMSSYQLDTLKTMQFDIGVILNITPDHLDRYDSMDHYIQSKKTQLTRVKAGGLKIIGIDTPPTEALYAQLLHEGHKDIHAVSFEKPIENGLFLKNGHLITATNGKTKLLCEVPDSIRGLHNIQNFMTTVLIGQYFGIDPQTIVSILSKFKGLDHRQQIVLDLPSVLFVNDSKATNAEATKPALDTFLNIYWIVGGVAKADGVTPLQQNLSNVEKIFLIGKSQERFEKELELHKEKIIKAETIEASLDYIKQNLPPHKITVLLSPACASQDQFKDFVHRGTHFKELVFTYFGEPNVC